MSDNKAFTKFFVASALFFVWVTVQGAIQAQKPVHEFVDQGPGSLIVGAHVHVGTLGWVSLALMGALYYFVPLVSGKPLSAPRLVRRGASSGQECRSLALAARAGALRQAGHALLEVFREEPRTVAVAKPGSSISAAYAIA